MLRLISVFCLFLSYSSFANEVDTLIKSASLIFEDDFNRIEMDDSQEQLGKEWVTNSKSRAKGTKQCDLTGEAVRITMAEVADHGVSMRHDVPFHNGIIVSRFKMLDKKGMKYNFNDPATRKVSWAGHVAGIDIKPNKLTIEDHIKGRFDLKLREMKQDPNRKKEALEILKSKQKAFKTKVDLDQWHDIIIIFQGPKVQVYLNNEKVGEFSSEGLNHNVKQNIALGVSGTVEVDFLKVYSLD